MTATTQSLVLKWANMSKYIYSIACNGYIMSKRTLCENRVVERHRRKQKVGSDGADIVHTTAVSVFTSNISTPLLTLVSIEYVHVPT
jgi:hypothetical protein